jgi:hypothetical protein
MEAPNTAALGAQLRVLGQTGPDLVRLFRSFNAGAAAFRAASEAYEHEAEA